jgi:transposase
VFGAPVAAEVPQVDSRALHAKIGQLAPENDLLEGALSKAGLLSVRR